MACLPARIILTLYAPPNFPPDLRVLGSGRELLDGQSAWSRRSGQRSASLGSFSWESFSEGLPPGCAVRGFDSQFAVFRRSGRGGRHCHVGSVRPTSTTHGGVSLGRGGYGGVNVSGCSYFVPSAFALLCALWPRRSVSIRVVARIGPNDTLEYSLVRNVTLSIQGPGLVLGSFLQRGSNFWQHGLVLQLLGSRD